MSEDVCRTRWVERWCAVVHLNLTAITTKFSTHISLYAFFSVAEYKNIQYRQLQIFCPSNLLYVEKFQYLHIGIEGTLNELNLCFIGNGLGFTTLLTSQVISIAFYSEREKSDKFCWKALISAWDSFTWRKSTTRDPRLYFPSEGSHTQDCSFWKNPSTPALFEPANLGSSGEYDNHGTTGIDTFTLFLVNYQTKKNKYYCTNSATICSFRNILGVKMVLVTRLSGW